MANRRINDPAIDEITLLNTDRIPVGRFGNTLPYITTVDSLSDKVLSNLTAEKVPMLTSAKISNFDSQVRTSRLDQMSAPESAVSFNSQRITNLANPSSAQDAGTKSWTDSNFASLSGSYSNPTWITSLSGSKITGSISGVPISGSTGAFTSLGVSGLTYSTHGAAFNQYNNSGSDGQLLVGPISTSALFGAGVTNAGYSLIAHLYQSANGGNCLLLDSSNAQTSSTNHLATFRRRLDNGQNPSAGFGVGVMFEANNNAGVVQSVGAIRYEVTSPGSNNVVSSVISVRNGGGSLVDGLTVTGTGINSTAVGATVPSTGAFTTLSSSSTTSLNGTTIPASSTLLVSGGALGTPSSGTVTNLTGTASININGTVGATTPSTGAFTTLSASGLFTSTGSGERIKLNGADAYISFFNAAGTTRTGYLQFNDATATQDVVLASSINAPIKMLVNASEVGRFSSTGLGVTGLITATTDITASRGIQASNYDAAGYTFRAVAGAGGSAILQFTNAAINTQWGSLAATSSSLSIGTDVAADVIIRRNSTTIGTFGSTGLAVAGTLSATGISSLAAARFNGTPGALGNGVGVEVGYTGSNGYVQSYDRTNNVYYPLNLQASEVHLGVSGSDKAVVTSTGLAVTGDLSASSNLDVTGTATTNLLMLTPEMGYATSGSITLRFDIKTNNYIGLTGNATFSVAGMASGRVLVFTLKNTTAGTITLSWPAWNRSGSEFPASLAAGASIVVRCEAYGTSLSNVFAQCSGGSASATIFNVKDYGALGDNSTNDASAINSAIAAINSAGRGCLYFPAGVYHIASALTTLTVPSTILGQGVETTILNLASVAGPKFNFSGATDHRTATVSDMTISSTSGGGSYYGLEYIPGTSGSALEKSFSFQRLQFSGGWSKAIYVNSGALNNIQGAVINDVLILGNIGNTSPTAIGIHVKNATLVMCTNIIGYWLDKMYYVTGDSEGLYLTHWTAAACTYGVFVAGSTTCSDFHFTHGFADIFSTGKALVLGDGTGNCVGGEVTNCYLAGRPGAYCAIESRGVRVKLANLDIAGFNQGIEVINWSSDYERHHIHDCSIDCSPAVTLGSGVEECMVHDISSSGTFTDSGSNNVMGDSRGFTNAFTLSGGSSTEVVSLDVTRCHLGKKPDAVTVCVAGEKDVGCTYDWGNGSNSKTTVYLKFFRYDGANLGTGPYRLNVCVNP